VEMVVVLRAPRHIVSPRLGGPNLDSHSLINLSRIRVELDCCHAYSFIKMSGVRSAPS